MARPKKQKFQETSKEDLFDKVFKQVLLLEGDYSDHPSDSGGKTRYGITQATARLYGYEGPMQEFPLAKAREIYEAAYWQKPNIDKVAPIAPALAVKLFDAGVNLGPSRMIRWLQTSLNALSNRKNRWDHLYVDGMMGMKTLYILERAVRHYHMEKILVKALNCIQGNYYIELSLLREKDQAFLHGWLKHRIGSSS